MQIQLDLNKIILIGFGLLIALAIPIYFIVGRFLNLRETEIYISQFSEERTLTAVPGSTETVKPTKTLFPTETPTPTLTPTPTPTPTEILIPDTGNPLNVYLDKVVHLDERGPQTMVKFVSLEPPIEGEFRAEVVILWNTYRYNCFILGDEEEQLYCIGLRLPESKQAYIQIYQLFENGEDEFVFESEFVVPAVFPTATHQPQKNTPKPEPTNTFTPTPTHTPTPTKTPNPTATPTKTPIPPSKTPKPTATSTNTPVPPTNTPTPTLGPPPTPWE